MNEGVDWKDGGLVFLSVIACSAAVARWVRVFPLLVVGILGLISACGNVCYMQNWAF